MMNIQVIEMQGQRVLTTKQIAEMYETTEQMATNNYNRNKDKYLPGKHYICLVGLEKAEFIKKNQNEFSSYTRAKAIYLWTEKGALLHAKSINTDKAWEVYDYLVDFYFRQQSKAPKQVMPPASPVPAIKPMTKQMVDIPVNEKFQEVFAQLHRELNAVEEVTRMLNRYQSEESFQKTLYVLERLCLSIGDKGFSLREIKPQLVEKVL